MKNAPVAINITKEEIPMSEKEKRDVVSTEKSDAVRFRDILKVSEDIMKTAYPSEKKEEEIPDTEKDTVKKESINPFTEEKKPKGKLDPDLAPDGRILVEDDPAKAKKDKERSRDKKKADKLKEKQAKRREKLLLKIRALEPKLALIRDRKVSTEDPREFQKYRKKEERLTKKINELNQRAVSPDQYTPSAGIYIKARLFKIWVIVLVVLVLIIAVLSTALISVTYKNLKHYQGDSRIQRQSVDALNNEVSSLNDEKNTVTREKASLEQENSELTEKVASLETELADCKYENGQLQIKADFLLKNIRIVNGNFFKKTYHIYGCTKANYSSYWAYNKEQVEGKAGYSACSHCIK